MREEEKQKWISNYNEALELTMDDQDPIINSIANVGLDKLETVLENDGYRFEFDSQGFAIDVVRMKTDVKMKKDLKEVLFTKFNEHSITMKKEACENGRTDEFLDAMTAFYSIGEIIDDAGLWGEYLSWKGNLNK